MADCGLPHSVSTLLGGRPNDAGVNILDVVPVFEGTENTLLVAPKNGQVAVSDQSARLDHCNPQTGQHGAVEKLQVGKEGVNRRQIPPVTSLENRVTSICGDLLLALQQRSDVKGSALRPKEGELMKAIGLPIITDVAKD